MGSATSGLGGPKEATVRTPSSSEVIGLASATSVLISITVTFVERRRITRPVLDALTDPTQATRNKIRHFMAPNIAAKDEGKNEKRWRADP